ncbi:DUF5131 family protein [Sorangium sp. So ce134]
MGSDSKIQWTHHTYNPWWGCEKVSPACKHCYAEAFAKRTGHAVWGGDASPRRFFGDKHWEEPIKWNRAAEKAGERHRVFCASMADVFEARDDLDPHRARLWELIETTPALDWLLLTKRPEEIMRRIPERWRDGLPVNVWVGTTVENQEMAEQRIPHLLRVPARVRFLSCEPLLEALNLCRIDIGADVPIMLDEARRAHVARRQYPDGSRWTLDALGGIVSRGDAAHPVDSVGWVIVGGESGPRARPFDLAWARHLLEQCRAANTAAFMKQGGSRPVDGGLTLRLAHRSGGDLAELPDDVTIREFPHGNA